MSSKTLDFFNGNHLRYLANFSKRVKGCCLEVITQDHSVHTIVYLHDSLIWKVAHLDPHGYLYMDFRKHLRKCLDGIEKISYIKLSEFTKEDLGHDTTLG